MLASLYVGTYTRKEGHVDGQGKGIYRLELNEENGSLRCMEVYDQMGTNPSYMVMSRNRHVLYVVNEHNDDLGKNGESCGRVAAYTLSEDGTKLSLLNELPSEGSYPCHISLDKSENFVFVSNYGSGSLVMYPLLENGGLSENYCIQCHHGGSGVVHDRQESSHMHCVVPSPDNRFVYAADLGSDKLWCYKLHEKQASCSSNETHFDTSPGSGPRHMVFHPLLNCMYIINELGNSVTLVKVNFTTGDLTSLQTLPSYPIENSGKSTGSAIQIDPCGRFLYVSNRGHDSITLFDIHPTTGYMTFVESCSTEGKCPRNFILHKNLLLVANQDSNSIVSFRRNELTGKLHKLEAIDIPSPVCLVLQDQEN